MRSPLIPLWLFASLFFGSCVGAAPAISNLSRVTVVDPATPREFPAITTLAQWQERAKFIREQILVSSGLWPMPEKTPLHPVIFGKLIRDGYSVEKVYFETYPGFYLAGNLYRPLGRGPGPFPAILNPHGHWEGGRLVDTDLCSLPGRCINFAKQGMIAFSYDLVGYNDTHFADSPTNLPFYKVHRSFATNNLSAQLWSISLMGLQTWNSIRAVDFLLSLPDADPYRLACAGESGGGTQTFMLGAVDDRLAAQAPVVMVSHTRQGGCLCENMPGLRVDFSNMEIAAAAAPRPQIIVGANGDWTKTTASYEGPAIAHVYQLFQKPDQWRAVQFDYPHNCNQTSRQALYQWFDRWLLKHPDEPVNEVAFKKEADEDLRVFPGGKLPPNALTENGLINHLIQLHTAELRALEPRDKSSLEKYKQILKPAWSHTLQLEWPDSHVDISSDPLPSTAGYKVQRLGIKVGSEAHTCHLLRFTPAATNSSAWSPFVVLVNSNGTREYLDDANIPIGLARKLLEHHIEVGIFEDGPTASTNNEHDLFFTTYNRTLLQERVRDLINVCNAVKFLDFKNYHVVLCGSGHAAYWSLLAAPAASAVVADCGRLDVSNDQSLLAPGLFCPGIRTMDTFAGAAILAAPHPLLLHDASPNFSVTSLRSSYRVLGAKSKLKIESHQQSEAQIVAWILHSND